MEVPETALQEEGTLEAEAAGPPWVVPLQWVVVPHTAPHPFLEPPSTGRLLQAPHHHTWADHLWDSHHRSEDHRPQCTVVPPWACLLQGDLHQWFMDHHSSAHHLASPLQDPHPSLELMSTLPSSPLAPLSLSPSMRYS